MCIGRPKGGILKKYEKISWRRKMTDTNERINEAFNMIDSELSRLQSREVVSAVEASDLLLDLLLLIMQIEPVEDPVSISS